MTMPLSSLSAARVTTGESDASRVETRANLEAAAARFESLFVGMMLKSARSASLGDGLFDSEATQTFRDMQDQKLAEEMGRRGTLGIARAMADFLSRGRPALTAEADRGPAS